MLLDNIELLFDVALHQDPLRVLQSLSQETDCGRGLEWIDGGKGHILYAAPGHPEHRRCPVDGVLVVDADAAK